MLAKLDLEQIQSSAFPNFKGGGTIGELISNLGIFDYLLAAAGAILLVYMVTAGLQMMASRGDPKAMQSAQGKITNAIIGLVIIIFSFGIVSLIGRVFKIEVFQNLF